MMARALGPGSDVLISGMDICSACSFVGVGLQGRRTNTLRGLHGLLLPLPASARRRILQQHPATMEVVSNTIRGGKITAPPCGMSIFNCALDLLHRHRRLLVFG